MSMSQPAIADVIISKLAVHLGPHVAKVAIQSFAKKAGIPRDQELTAVHVPGLMAEIRPMLNVMIGRGSSDAVVADIERITLTK